MDRRSVVNQAWDILEEVIYAGGRRDNDVSTFCVQPKDWWIADQDLSDPEEVASMCMDGFPVGCADVYHYYHHD